ncbi:DoxX family protein [Sphaerimonospora sp. CA-214678]|uniref:DoxX family protein n=1 Tax=Sphaerimonospora sp. CA-214678 TaxID=3240029 RepID=UPI003D912F45
MKRSLQDLAALTARLGVGGIFFVNGWHKLEAGLTSTGAQFAELQAPMPGLWAAATMLIEIVGGTLLIAGLAVPAVGLLLFAEALAVFVLTAGDPGLPLTGGDIRLIVALGAASVLLAVTGGGRASVDHMVVIKRREAEEAGDLAADTEADAVIASLREPHDSGPRDSGPRGRESHGTGGSDAAAPTKTEPGKTETAKTETAKTRPTDMEPAGVKPAKTDPASTESTNVEPANGESGAGAPPAGPRARVRKSRRAGGEGSEP